MKSVKIATICVLICICLVCTFSLAAMAEEVEFQSHASADHATFEQIETADQLATVATNGGVAVLLNDIDTTATITVPADVTLSLCLNGKKIAYTGQEAASVFTVNGTLNLADCCTDQRNGHIGVETNLWQDGDATESDEFACNVVGGLITGGHNANGGGIFLSATATVNMYGGNIVANTATTNGGGAYITSGAQFNMYGGSIINNRSANYMTCAVYKKGKSLQKGGTFNQVGGTTGGTWGGIDWTFEVTGQNGLGHLTIAPTKIQPEPNPQFKNQVRFPVGDWREAVKYTASGGAEAIIDNLDLPYTPTKVNELTIEHGVNRIGSFALQNAPATGELVIPSTVTYIGQEVFLRSKFSVVTFATDENGTTQLKCIAQGAFKYMNILQIELVNGIECVHAWAFLGCADVEYIKIPASMQKMSGQTHVDYANYGSIGADHSGVFNDNSSLEQIEFEDATARDKFLNSNVIGNIPVETYTGLTGYTNPQDAIDAAAASGETVVVIGNFVVPAGETLVIPEGVTLDLNGKTLTNKGEIINSGTIQGTGTLNNTAGIVADNGGTIAGEISLSGAPVATYIAITYQLDGGSVAGANPTYYAEGMAPVTLINPTKVGFNFIGWSGDGLDGNENLTVVVENLTQDQTYIANWEAIVYNVDLTVNAPSGITLSAEYSLDKTQAIMGEQVTLLVNCASGFPLEKVSASDDVQLIQNDDGSYTFVMPASDVTITVSTDLSSIGDDLSALNQAIDNLAQTTEQALANKVDISALTDAIDALTQQIATAKSQANNYTDTQVALLQTSLQTAEDTLNQAVSALQSAVQGLQSDLATANGNINTNATSITQLQTDLATLQSLQTVAQDALDSLQTLANNQGVNVAQLTGDLTNLQSELNTTNTNIATVQSRVDALESQFATLQSTLSSLTQTTEQALANKADISALTDAIDALTQQIATAKSQANNYTDTQVALLQTALQTAEDTLNQAVSALQSAVQGLQADLATANGNINTNATSITQLQTDLATLQSLQTAAQDAIDSLQTLTSAQGSNITQLQDDLTDLQSELNTTNTNIATVQSRVDALESQFATLQSTLSSLTQTTEQALANKADISALTDAIDALTQQIATAKSQANNYTDTQVALLQTALQTAEDTLNQAVSALQSQVSTLQNAQTALQTAVANLETAVNSKADTATLNQSVTQLTQAIADAEAAAKLYADGKQTALTSDIATAKQQAISAAENLVAQAKAELQNAINNKVSAADFEAAVNNLQNAISALQGASDSYIAADQALKAELQAIIEQAKKDALAQADETNKKIIIALGALAAFVVICNIILFALVLKRKNPSPAPSAQMVASNATVATTADQPTTPDAEPKQPQDIPVVDAEPTLVEQPVETPVEQPDESAMDVAVVAAQPDTDVVVGAQVAVAGGAVYDFGVRYDYSFEARLAMSTDEVKDFWRLLVKHASSYGVKVSRNWNNERIYLGRNLYAMLVFKGKKLAIALAKDPTTAHPKYFATDVSNVRKFARTPMLMTITSDRKVKFATDLLDEIFTEAGLKRKKTSTSVPQVVARSKDELLDAGLIKPKK